jgi:tripartite-type tricarboxylate transporter receptor subunit TctC
MSRQSTAWRVPIVVVASALLCMAAAAQSQTYPDRRITLIVPYTAGSGFDFTGRTIGQKMSERWGQPVIIDNKPGASGDIGAEAVANAEPDGYTILVTGPPHSVSPALHKNLRFDPIASFTPLGAIGTSALALVVNPNVMPVNSVDEFLAALRAKPGYYNYSSPGTGTLQHLGMELFKQELGLNAVHVPYRGASIALTDLLTGQVQFTFLPVHSARPHVQAGRLRMLAVASPRRSPFAPEVPSFADVGLPAVDFELWYGFFAPARLPVEITRKWERELAAISKLDELQNSYERQGMVPSFRNSGETAAHLASEIKRWRSVAEKAGIKPD